MSVNNMKAGRTPEAGLFRPAVIPHGEQAKAADAAACEKNLLTKGAKAVSACLTWWECVGDKQIRMGARV